MKIPGLTERITTGGVCVLRVHYGACAGKRPGTEPGDAWMQVASAAYPGGTRSPRWRKEMEIDYGALAGEKAFPFWEMWRMGGRIVVPPFSVPGYRLYGTYDHGWRHKCCYLVHGVGSDGRRVTLWEFYADHVPVSLVARIIKGQDVTVPPIHTYGVRRFQGNPFAGQEVWKRADPSIFAEDQPQSDNTMRSVAWLFQREGVHFLAGQRGGDTTVVEWLHSYDWMDPMQPTHVITTACPGLIYELGKLRFKDLSAAAQMDKASPEGLVDKENDAWDAFKMFLLEFPPTPQEKQAVAQSGTFAWWKKQVKTASEGGVPSTYRRELVQR